MMNDCAGPEGPTVIVYFILRTNVSHETAPSPFDTGQE